MNIEYAKVSAVGDRQDNQDRAAVVAAEEAAIMLVFDGMGGHENGALAAETGLRVVRDMFVASTLPLFDPQGFLYTSMASANDEVVRIGSDVRSIFGHAQPARSVSFRKTVHGGATSATAVSTTCATVTW